MVYIGSSFSITFHFLLMANEHQQVVQNCISMYAILSFSHFFRQCMCCFKDYKNFEKFNNIVQVILHRGIRLIQTLPKDCRWQKEQTSKGPETKNEGQTAGSGDGFSEGKTKQQEEPTETGKSEAHEKGSVKSQDCPKADATGSEQTLPVGRRGEGDGKLGETGKENEESVSKKDKEKLAALTAEEIQEEQERRQWSLEEKDAVFQFVTKVFLMNFPLYLAYKHCVHSTLEELSAEEAGAFSSYCELAVS